METKDKEFQSHEVNLCNPAAEELRDAFMALPRQGCIDVLCPWERRLEMLSLLEESGAFAINFSVLDAFASVRIIALKGKSGPCYDTGRRAIYAGQAAAVLDDDHHLIVGELRVCEKTGGLYQLWPYRRLLNVSAADPVLMARLDSDPIPFDCNTFAADSLRLLEMFREQMAPEEKTTAVVYTGPFRALVLADGSVLRRGVPALVTPRQEELNHLLRLPAELSREAGPCEHYVTAYHERGQAFLLESLGNAVRQRVTKVQNGGVGALSETALAALSAAPRSFKQRLLQLIDGCEPYLVLTGSDPEVPGGCCPSTQVGVANRLVRAAALQSHAPSAPPDSCTVSFYAFPGEIVDTTADQPAFIINTPVRKQVAARLRDDRKEGMKQVLRMGLLGLAGISLGLSAWQALSVPLQEHGTQMCAFCEEAMKMARWVALKRPVHAFGTVLLGMLAAIQPCSLAVLAGVLAWRPGGGRWSGVAGGGAFAVGAAVSSIMLAVAAAWGLTRAAGGFANGLQVFSGPLLIIAGLPLTGLFQIPVREARSGPKKRGGVTGLFIMGAATGAIWCPVSAGLLAVAVLPSAVQHGTPLRDALLFGAGYSVIVFFLCATAALGGQLVKMHSVFRRVKVTAGWCLILLGGALSFW